MLEEIKFCYKEFISEHMELYNLYNERKKKKNKFLFRKDKEKLSNTGLTIITVDDWMLFLLGDENCLCLQMKNIMLEALDSLREKI